MLFAAILISAFGGFVMFAARTGPDEATSNISKWMAFMGVPPPRWLARRTTDHWAARLAFLLMIGGGIIFCAWVYGKAQTSPPMNPPSTFQQNNQGGTNRQFNAPGGTINLPSTATKQNGDCNVGGNNNGVISCFNTYTDEPVPEISPADAAVIRSTIPAGASIVILKYINGDREAEMEDRLRHLFNDLGYQCCSSGVAFAGPGGIPKGIQILPPKGDIRDWFVKIGRL
jgi:hypothetical protein